MLKFIQHHMDTITNIEMYPVISFCLFFGVFVVASCLAITSSRAHIDEMKNMPLGNDKHES